MNGIIDSISNLLMPLCSVWIVNKFVNNSFEKKESKRESESPASADAFVISEYYGAAEPPVRCGESHLSGLTEPPHFIY